MFDITQEDLLLVLKSVKDELVAEEQEAQKAAKEKAEKESSESSSSTEDSSPAPMKKAAKEESESSETSTESSKAKPFEKKKSAEEVQVEQVEQEPVDLYQTYVGLGQESIEDLKNHSIAANMALLAHAGQDMTNHWTAFKSAKEDLVVKSAEEIDQALQAEIEAAKAFAAKTEDANQKLVEQNTVLEKSLKETQEAVAQLTVKFAELAKQPQASQAATVKTSAPEQQVLVSNPQDIVKSLADAALKDGLTDKDRELITRYTIRPKMTEELKDLLKKIGSVK